MKNKMYNCCFEILDAIDEGIVLLGEDFRVAYWNKYMIDITEISKEKVLYKRLDEILPKFKGETFKKAFKNTIENNQKFFFSAALHKNFIPTKKKGLCKIRQNLKMSAISNGDKRYVLMEFIDVTGEYLRINQMKNYIKNIKEIEQSLEISEIKYKLLFENMDRGFLHTMIVTDDEGKLKDLVVLNVNKVLLKSVGLKEDEVPHKSAIALFKPFINRKKDIEKILKYAMEGKTLKIDQLYIRKLKKTVQISGYSSGLDTYGFIITDITEQKKNEEIIKNLAYFDHLTRLYNRRFFLDKAEEYLEKAKNEGTKLALMILDVDDFKEINDSYGHFIGDKVLESISFRIIKSIRRKDLAGRYGGDEFLLLMSNVNSDRDVKKFAKRVISQVKKPVNIEGKTIYPSISMGISVYPRDGESIHQLLKKADEKLYKVKHEGGGSYNI